MKTLFKQMLFVAILCGCVDVTAEYKKMLETWIGAPEIELIRTWGSPARTYTTNDITYVTFYDSKLYQLDQYQCQTTFGIRDNVVFDYSFYGNNCIPPLDDKPEYIQ